MSAKSDRDARALEKISVRPEVTILSVLRHLNYKPWFAIAEFVDNSIQSYQENRERLLHIHGPAFKLRVTIDLDRANDRIVIRDNAAGIRISEFARAFRPAELPVDRTGLSEFGMGMKSAACWFSNRWRVHTKAIDEAVERVVDFDIERIVSTKSDEVSVEEVPGTPEDHFTEIRLLELGDKVPQGNTWKKLQDHLASIYREFLRSGQVEILVDGKLLHYDEPEVLVSPFYKTPKGRDVTWRKEIGFDFGRGLSVKGFAALRKTGSTTHAGFALFRRGRLIQGSADEPYRPFEIFGSSNSYRYQRLFGELHLQGFDVSHTKDGFRWKDNEETFLELLRNQLEEPPLNLFEQAEGFRSLQNRRTLEDRAASATQNVAQAVEANAPVVIQEELASPSSPTIPGHLEARVVPVAQRKVRIPVGEEVWEIVVQCIVDPEIGDLVRIARSEEADPGNTEVVNALEIELNLGHLFAKNFNGPNGENTELLARVAAALCLGEVLASHTQPDNLGRVLLQFNDLISRALSKI